MSKNIRKFTSQADYDAYKANDGWDYPSVSFVETDIDSQVHYNNEFIMRWNTADTSKTPSFYGEISHDTFKAWVDSASKPCEVNKLTGEVTDYTMDGNNVRNWGELHRTDPGYLQMTRIKNVNVGCFQDTSKGIKEVRFNFDEGCPSGFHKWFPNTAEGSGNTKLWGRYDVIPNGTTDDNTGICLYAGDHMGAVGQVASTWGKGNWSANKLISAYAKDPVYTTAGKRLLEMTYWEHYVLTMIFSAYHKTFNHQSKFWGLSSGWPENAGTWENGLTEATLNTPHGTLAASSPETTTAGMRFMHMENPIYGKQWIWGAGWLGRMTEAGGQYKMTFDDLKANDDVSFNNSNTADFISELTVPSGSVALTLDGNGDYSAGSLPWGRTDPKYVTDIDVYGVPCSVFNGGGSNYKTGYGSSSTGFYDAMYSYSMNNSYVYVAYLGGSSSYGDRCGGFARNFTGDASDTYWNRRGRVTMNA